MRALLLSLALAAVLGAATRARADDDFVPVADRVLRLDAVLHTQHDRAEVGRMTSGILIGVVGAGAVGFGIGAAVSSIDLRYLGVLIGAAGVAYLVIGAGLLAVPTPAEDRWTQWSSLRARGPVPPAELARYEGELRLEARQEEAQRTVTAYAGFGLVAFGAGLAVGGLLVPTSTHGESTILLATGGAVGVAGLVWALLSFLVEPPAVKELRMYLHGMAPRRDDGPHVQVVPTAGPTSGGLALVGTF